MEEEEASKLLTPRWISNKRDGLRERNLRLAQTVVPNLGEESVPFVTSQREEKGPQKMCTVVIVFYLLPNPHLETLI